MILRRIFLLSLVLCAWLEGCGVTEWQRMQDRQAAAAADLYSPAMNKAVCAAGAMTKACGWKGE